MERTKYTRIESSPDTLISELELSFGRQHEAVGRDDLVELFAEYPHALLPTIGIEIELPRRELDRRLDYAFPRGSNYAELSRDDKDQADQIFNDIDRKWRPKMDALKQAGVLIGNDNFAEIISPPYFHNRSLSDLTNYLFSAEFMPEGGELPLHITLGGINVKGKNLQVQYLARMLELMEGSSDKRIQEPLMGGQRQWTRKNDSGFLLRSSQELAGGQTDGIELRALAAINATQVGRVLWRAQWLGACLKAWLEATESERADSVAEVSFEDYERGVLIDAWKRLTGFFDDLYEANGIKLNELWGGPASNPQVWTRHRVMCSTALGNIDNKRKVCDIVDQTLREVEQRTALHHSRRLDAHQV